MDEQTQKQHDELVTIAGGVELEVKYQNNGDKEKVKVRQIPISKMATYVQIQGDEAQCIELYCDKPKGWADTLTLESANAIADKGEELNLAFFGHWLRRAMNRLRLQTSQQPGSTTTAGSENPGAVSTTRSLSASSPPQSPTTTS